jgi:3-hydroxybutyryl-CoA dehydrogenase
MEIKQVGVVGCGLMSSGIADAMFEEYKDPRYAAPPLLRRMVLASHLGRKSGKGFYDYT